jgi:phospholipid transport system substrate-binding protein
MLRQSSKNLRPARIRMQCAWMSVAIGTILLTTSWTGLLMAAGDEQPLDALQRTVEDGMRILKDPLYATAVSKALQQAKLREVLYRDFDFTEFSRRVLAEKWAVFSGPQRVEFIKVFSRFLAEYYLARLQQYYAGEKVVFRGQEITGPGRAIVKTQVIWKKREFPVDVRMNSRAGRWKAYDVSMIGVSAVQIYRAQFQEILSTQTPAQVIELIKHRLGED